MLSKLIWASWDSGPASLRCIGFCGPTPARKGADLPFHLMRKQFPVRIAYAMTINKAVYLEHSVFSHGQLYVAMSRVGAASCIKILVLDDGEQSFHELCIETFWQKTMGPTQDNKTNTIEARS